MAVLCENLRTRPDIGEQARVSVQTSEGDSGSQSEDNDKVVDEGPLSDEEDFWSRGDKKKTEEDLDFERELQNMMQESLEGRTCGVMIYICDGVIVCSFC